MDPLLLKYTGKIIKQNRISKGMKQKELAKGICSVSYLSKFEKGLVLPNEEVIEQLKEKLSAEDRLVKQKNKSFHYNLEKFHIAIIEKNNNEMENIYKQLNLHSSLNQHEELLYRYEVYKMLYFNYKGEINKTKRIIDSLEETINVLPEDVRYYFHCYSGRYYYYIQDFQKSYEHYSKAETLFYYPVLSLKEKGDFFYSLAMACCQINKLQMALTKGKQSLSFYQSDYNIKSSMEAHVLLGIAYRKNAQYQEALDQYSNAKKAMVLCQDYSIHYIIEHNLGYLNSKLGFSEESLEFFKKCVELTNESQMDHKIHSILSLTHEYYKLGLKQEAIKWINEASSILEQNEGLRKLYKVELLTNKLLITQDWNKLEENIMEIIHHYEGKAKYYDLSIYLEKLAEKLFSISRYKKSANYFQLSLQYFKKSQKEIN
ncbi:helix-turn-helix transcriptional regulator [Rossellomorea vietnamensis]|uniref:helix-turn-helix domain-containing protein n=1 Tax=Rossellomorea vietnamensis TaxID=218284 RepID=UPI003D279C73